MNKIVRVALWVCVCVCVCVREGGFRERGMKYLSSALVTLLRGAY